MLRGPDFVDAVADPAGEAGVGVVVVGPISGQGSGIDVHHALLGDAALLLPLAGAGPAVFGVALAAKLLRERRARTATVRRRCDSSPLK